MEQDAMTNLFVSVFCANLMALAAAPAVGRTVTMQDRMGCGSVLSQQKRLEALWRGVEADRLRIAGKETPTSKAAGVSGYATLDHINRTQCTLLRGSFKVIEIRNVRGIEMQKLAVANSVDQWVWVETLPQTLENLKLLQQSATY